MQKEKFHTHLTVLYLERVLSLMSQSPKDEEQLTKARERLQALLRESNLYRVQFLLGEKNICLFVPNRRFCLLVELLCNISLKILNKI